MQKYLQQKHIDFALLKSCINGNRKSQKKLYEILSPVMYHVCLKFFDKVVDAEDVLQEGFIKLFNNLHNYRGDGSFEGWARRIFVNTSIQYYHNQKPVSISTNEFADVLSCANYSALDRLYEKDVIKISSTLSNGYKTVFQLYAVEGYSHKEIAQILGITESTSKSQYMRAKASIREKIGKRA